MLVVRYIGKRAKDIFEAHEVSCMLLFGFLFAFFIIFLAAKVSLMLSGQGVLDGFWWINIPAGVGLVIFVGVIVCAFRSLFCLMKREVMLYKRYADKFRGSDSKDGRGEK